jgi:hypothetical protein
MQHGNMDLLKQILINYHNSYSLEVAAKIIPEMYICVYFGNIFVKGTVARDFLPLFFFIN